MDVTLYLTDFTYEVLRSCRADADKVYHFNGKNWFPITIEEAESIYHELLDKGYSTTRPEPKHRFIDMM